MLWKNRSFTRLLAALTISQLGDWLYNVALLAYVFEQTHSAAWLGATTVARVLPIVVFGPLGGLLGDRFDRRMVMVVSDLARVAAMIGLVVVARYDLPLMLAPALAAFSTAASSPYPSCVAATMPRVLARDELTAANSVRSAVGPLAIITGPLIGAAVLAAGGIQWAFAANAATFAISAVLVLAIRDRAAFRPTGSTGARESAWRELTAGARELLRRRTASQLVGADTLCSLCYGVETVALVAVSMHLGMDGSGYGMLLAAIGAGGLLGTAVLPRLSRRFGRRPIIATALVAVAVTMPLLAVLPSLPLVLGVAAVNGAGSLIVEVCAETVLQEELPDEVFARAYGVALPVSIGGIALGSAIVAPLTALLGLTGALSLVGALLAAYAVWVRTSRRPATAPRAAAGAPVAALVS
jgi:MFS family permease